MDKLFKNMEKFKTHVNEKDLYSNNFIKTHTNLSTFSEFLTKINPNNVENIDDLEETFKTKIIKEISNFKTWDDFKNLAQEEFVIAVLEK